MQGYQNLYLLKNLKYVDELNMTLNIVYTFKKYKICKNNLQLKKYYYNYYKARKTIVFMIKEGYIMHNGFRLRINFNNVITRSY